MIATHRHLRAARALSGLSQSELAKLAGVSVVTIKRMESFGGLVGIRPTKLHKVEEALETTGVVVTKGGVRIK
jgi:predicted transcriptional regulator